jgi:hypothetical protein
MTAAISMAGYDVPNQIHKAIEQAADRTGMDFDYLLHQAKAESSFDPNARAKTSSAEGLYQFLDQTWLSMVKRHGHKYGLGDHAEQISHQNGKYTAPAGIKENILNIRRDPAIAAAMAGEFAGENKGYLERHTKGPIGPVELYFAHFLGASGAAKFLNQRAMDGTARAADHFPAAAMANNRVFYGDNGAARSLDQVYEFFARKFEDSESFRMAAGGAAKPGQPEPTSYSSSRPSLTRQSVNRPAHMDQLSLMIQAQLMASLSDLSGDDGGDWSDVF